MATPAFFDGEIWAVRAAGDVFNKMIRRHAFPSLLFELCRSGAWGQ
jgi:hypothetical protein